MRWRSASADTWTGQAPVTTTVLGWGTASPLGAALANSTFGHAIDYGNTFESMVLYPSAPVFSAALTVVDESAGATGHDLLTGYVLGVEAAFRVGHSAYPSHYDYGWHHTGTIGSFGAAAASVLDLLAKETTHAFGIVASGSSELKNNFGSMAKPLHSGQAAQTGLRAAMLAAAGFTADEATLNGEVGYGTVMSLDGFYAPTVIEGGVGHLGRTRQRIQAVPVGGDLARGDGGDPAARRRKRPHAGDHRARYSDAGRDGLGDAHPRGAVERTLGEVLHQVQSGSGHPGGRRRRSGIHRRVRHRPGDPRSHQAGLQ